MTTTGQAAVIGLHWGFSLLPAALVLSVISIPHITKSRVIISISRRNAE
jgi:hypothetical protein